MSATADYEALAKRWMPGYRQGSHRPAWQHPEDVAHFAALFCKGHPLTEESQHAIAVAWMHDVLEDGYEGSRKVTAQDMRDAGVPDAVIADVQALTHDSTILKLDYLRSLIKANYTVRYVKCCDRLANLREGRATFKPARWERYVAQTRDGVLALVETLDEPTRGAIREWIQIAMDAPPPEKRK